MPGPGAVGWFGLRALRAAVVDLRARTRRYFSQLFHLSKNAVRNASMRPSPFVAWPERRSFVVRFGKNVPTRSLVRFCVCVRVIMYVKHNVVAAARWPTAFVVGGGGNFAFFATALSNSALVEQYNHHRRRRRRQCRNDKLDDTT